MSKVAKVTVIGISSFLLLLISTISFSAEVIYCTITNPDGSVKATYYQQVNTKEGNAEVISRTVTNPDGSVIVNYYQKIATKIVDKDNNIIESTGRVPDGIVRGYLPNLNGELGTEVNYLNNLPEGIMKIYNRNGQVIAEMEFKGGSPGPYKQLNLEVNSKKNNDKNADSGLTPGKLKTKK